MSRRRRIRRWVGPILWLEHVTKHYGRRRVLDDANVTFPKGSFTLLTGANGAGKTTLLRLLSTYAAPSAGTVHWVHDDGTELRDPAKIRARLGYAGHTPLVWDELTVRENVALQLRLRRRPQSAVDPWLRRLDLIQRADDRADTLSRGMRQRVALASALAHEPAFVLLDEPGSNLDPASHERLQSVLAEIHGRATVVVATHEPAQFRSLADRIVSLEAGKVHASEAAS